MLKKLCLGLSVCLILAGGLALNRGVQLLSLRLTCAAERYEYATGGSPNRLTSCDWVITRQRGGW